MAQYFRYCEHVDVKFGIHTCRKTGKIIHRPDMKHTNRCKLFKLNPIDALRENLKGYRPTGRKIVQFGGLGRQVKMSEILEGEDFQ